MIIHELRIDNYVTHKGELCKIAAISQSEKVIIQNVEAKKFSKPVDRGQLLTVQLTKEIYRQVGFKITDVSFDLGKVHVLNVEGFPTYIKDPLGKKILIGVCSSLHRLQNLYYEVHNEMLKLP